MISIKLLLMKEAAGRRIWFVCYLEPLLLTQNIVNLSIDKLSHG